MIPAVLFQSPMSPEEAAPWVTAAEQREAAAFGSERRRREYLTWRAVVRRELGADVTISYNEVGAPVVDRPVFISVAHCAECVAVCISDRRCAVDVESVTRDFARVATRYMTPAESALSSDPLLPAALWCAKEALYKYAGRKELDLLCDLHVEAVDFTSGTLRGRIENGEPIGLSVCRGEGFIAVYCL